MKMIGMWRKVKKGRGRLGKEGKERRNEDNLVTEMGDSFDTARLGY